jgi:hypothetical protein
MPLVESVRSILSEGFGKAKGRDIFMGIRRTIDDVVLSNAPLLKLLVILESAFLSELW